MTFNHIPFVSAVDEMDGYRDDGAAPTLIKIGDQPVFRHTVSNFRDVLAKQAVRLESLTAAPRQHVQSNACTALLDKPKDLCGLARQIDDDPAGLKLRCRTSIHDPDAG